MDHAEDRPLREFGRDFDDVAAEYDAVRPSYPAELIEAAFEAGALNAHSNVLEVGCGTGKLTELLVSRGLRVHAVEPGTNLVAAARRRIGQTGAVQFDINRFEDTQLSEGCYDAVFSATAFHWVDPGVSWAKAASALKPRGLLALFTHIGIHDERSTALEEQLLELLREHAPAIAEEWKYPLTLDAVVVGAHNRASNASEVWDWIMGEGRHAMAIPRAAALFDCVKVTTRLEHEAQTADQVLAHMRTTSVYFMLPSDRRRAFEDSYRRLIESNGGTFAFSRAAILMTARKSAGHASS